MVVVMLILALVLSLMTSMAGSSRTLYQASLDGWLPRYLAKVNGRRAHQRHADQLHLQSPAAAAVRLVFIIGAANVGYLIFNFLNLNAGWIHRCDRPRQERPWRAPTWIWRPDRCSPSSTWPSWASGPIRTDRAPCQGLAFAALIVPVFIYRHYVQDRGSFPQQMAEDLDMVGNERIVKRAGIWPYAVLALGVVIVAGHPSSSRCI